MTTDELFMLRALELARTGIGAVSPNPCVGCVIVVDGVIVGEGWHRQYGGPHAEVNAISGISDDSLLTSATVYVNLEPCAHFGKTPPCADLLVAKRVKRVVIGNVDSNPLVGGKGILKLKEGGIEVTVGVLENAGRELNQRFFTFIEKQRPWIILKWAETADHFIARSDFNSKWISNQYSRQLVHRWRSEEDAALVGTNTALHDDPELTVRHWSGRNPLRIAIDRHLRLPATLKLMNGAVRTLCYNLIRGGENGDVSFVKLDEQHFVEQLVSDLFRRKVQSVIIEGGAETLRLFIESGMWDEARIFSSTQSFGTGIEAPILRGEMLSTVDVHGDSLSVFRNPLKKD